MSNGTYEAPFLESIKYRHIPPAGSAIFQPTKDDARRIWTFVAEGIHGGYVQIGGRFPAICCERPKPETTSVIYMKDKPPIARPLMPDPYLPRDVA